MMSSQTTSRIVTGSILFLAAFGVMAEAGCCCEEMTYTDCDKNIKDMDGCSRFLTGVTPVVGVIAAVGTHFAMDNPDIENGSTGWVVLVIVFCLGLFCILCGSLRLVASC